MSRSCMNVGGFYVWYAVVCCCVDALVGCAGVVWSGVGWCGLGSARVGSVRSVWRWCVVTFVLTLLVVCLGTILVCIETRMINIDPARN